MASGDRPREPLRGAAIAIVAAAIAAGGTLAGSYTATLSARDQLTAQIAHEDSIRQYDLRRDTYKRFILVAHEYQEDLGNFAMSTDKKRASELEKDLSNDVSRIETVVSEIELVGGTETGKLAGAIRNALNDAVFATGTESPAKIKSRVDGTFPMLDSFIEAAREELNK
jgi:hypothetical protein